MDGVAFWMVMEPFSVPSMNPMRFIPAKVVDAWKVYLYLVNSVNIAEISACRPISWESFPSSPATTTTSRRASDFGLAGERVVFAVLLIEPGPLEYINHNISALPRRRRSQ